MDKTTYNYTYITITDNHDQPDLELLIHQVTSELFPCTHF